MIREEIREELRAPFARIEERLDAVVEGKADLDKARTDNGATPLFEAALKNNVEVVRYLLSKGADREIETKRGDTALSAAQQNGHTAVVELLL